jgi:hypothetical protein
LYTRAVNNQQLPKECDHIPCFDFVMQKDSTAALVLGLMWRYAIFKDGVCKASVHTLAINLAISEKTVRRKIALLEEFELIKDNTPSLRYQPHEYIINEEQIKLLSDGFEKILLNLKHERDVYRGIIKE